jgi:hypothetical protein
MHYMYIKFSCLAHTTSNQSNIIYSIQVIQQKIFKQEEEEALDTLGGLCPPSLDIIGALTLYHLLVGLFLRLLSGLHLLLPGLLLLHFSIDISSKCLIILPSRLKFFLGYNQFLF